MMDVTVKTLDGQNKHFSVPEDTTVSQFKEKIAGSIGITADTQRLIFHGRVMQDEKLLREYDVHGKVIHVVQRAPPSLASESDSQSQQVPPPHHHHVHHPPNLQSVLVGSVTFPPEILNAQLPMDGGSVIHIVGHMTTTINSRTTPTSTVSSSGTPVSGGPGLHTNNGSGSGSISEAVQRLQQSRRNLQLAQNAINRLEAYASARRSGGPATDSTPPVVEAGQDGGRASSTSEQAENQNGATPVDLLNPTYSGEDLRQSGAPHNLAELLREVQATYQRLSPFMDQLSELAAEDPEISSEDVISRQRMVDHVSEALHALSHCFHNISDLNYELSAPPPRSLTAQRLPIYQSQHPPNILNPQPGRNQAAGVTSTQTSTAQSVPQSTTAASASPTVQTFSFPSRVSRSSQPGATATASPERTSTEGLRGANLPAPGDDPYVFVEVGPDSLTVNSISTHVVMSDDTEDVGVNEGDNTANAAAGPTFSTASLSTPSASGPLPSSQNQPQDARPGMSNVNVQGLGSIPGLTGEMVNSIVQSVLQAHGVRQDQPAAGPSMSAGRGQQPPPAPPFHLFLGPPTRPHAPSTAGAPGGPVFARIPIFRQRAPGPHTLLPMPLMQPTDIYLPCFSHHFITQGVREIVDQTQRLQATGNLGNMMAGMMSSLFGQPLHARGPPIPPRQPQQPGGTPQRSASDNSSRAQTNTTATQQGSISANPFAALFSQLLGGATPAGASQSGGGRTAPDSGASVAGLAAAVTSMLSREVSEGSSTTAAAGEQNTMTDDMFARIVQGIGAQASQAAEGNPSGETVATFLQSLVENHSVIAGEGFLTDAFLCVAQHLTFANLFSIFLGQVDPIRGLQRPLQQFLRERVLGGNQFNERNLQSGTDRLLGEVVPLIQTSLEGFEVVPDVDLEATLNSFFRHHLLTVFRLILSSPDNDVNFGRNLYEYVRRLLEEFVVLMPMCLRGGQAAFSNMVQSRLESISSGLSPMIRQWMVSMTLQQLSTFCSSVTIPDSDLQTYIVHTSAAPAGCFPASDITNSETCDGCTVEPGMEVESHPPAGTSRPRVFAQAPQTLDLNSPSVRAEVRGQDKPLANMTQQVMVNGNHDVLAASPSYAARSPRNEEDNWQEIVPREWVPIIESDIQRQKAQRPQAPLSDAYLQGMPPKRRRLMTCDRPTNLSNMADYLPTAVKRAATQAGVEPVSSVENLAAEASDAEELQNMLEDEVQRSLANRLANDDDYSADRFPNAQQYFVSNPKPS